MCKNTGTYHNFYEYVICRLISVISMLTCIAYLTPGHIPGQNCNSKRYRLPMFIAALFTIAKIWKQSKCLSTDQWRKKMWYIHTVQYYGLSCFSCVWRFVTLWTVACQAPLSMGFSRQPCWSGLPCPSPGDLPNAGIKPVSPAVSALQVDSFHWATRGYYSAIKKEWNNVTCSRDYHTEWSQTEKDKYCMISLVWNLKYGTNETSLVVQWIRHHFPM